MSNGIRPAGAGQASGVSTTPGDSQTTTVKAGETQLSQIADRLGVSKEALMAANPNLTSENVSPGQELNLPQNQAPTNQQPQVTPGTDATPRANADAMRGDLAFGGQMREMLLRGMIPGSPASVPIPVFSDTKVAQAASGASDSLRLKTLPAQLEKANIPKNVRDDLLAQMSKKSGAELKQLLDQTDAALKSKDPAGELKSLVMQGNVDSYFQSFNATYDIGGKKVEATPHFRMTHGASGPSGRTDASSVRADLQKLIQDYDKKHPNDPKLWNKEMYDAVRFVAGGKPSAAQVKMVTDALIKADQFKEAKTKHSGLSDSETIRMMQWDHGIGIDCAGYVSQAFVGAHGGTRGKFGLQSVSDESLMDLKGNRHFSQVKPTDIRPGDLIALNPPANENVGHTVLVRDHHVANAAERGSYKDIGSEAFAKPTDKIHVYQVDASWGAGPDGKLTGGLQHRTWLYNEDSGKWALTFPDGKGGFEIRASSTNGPYDHPMNGIYRPKGE